MHKHTPHLFRMGTVRQIYSCRAALFASSLQWYMSSCLAATQSSSPAPVVRTLPPGPFVLPWACLEQCDTATAITAYSKQLVTNAALFSGLSYEHYTVAWNGAASVLSPITDGLAMAQAAKLPAYPMLIGTDIGQIRAMFQDSTQSALKTLVADSVTNWYRGIQIDLEPVYGATVTDGANFAAWILQLDTMLSSAGSPSCVIVAYQDSHPFWPPSAMRTVANTSKAVYFVSMATYVNDFSIFQNSLKTGLATYGSRYIAGMEIVQDDGSGHAMPAYTSDQLQPRFTALTAAGLTRIALWDLPIAPAWLPFIQGVSQATPVGSGQSNGGGSSPGWPLSMILAVSLGSFGGLLVLCCCCLYIRSVAFSPRMALKMTPAGIVAAEESRVRREEAASHIQGSNMLGPPTKWKAAAAARRIEGLASIAVVGPNDYPGANNYVESEVGYRGVLGGTGIVSPALQAARRRASSAGAQYPGGVGSERSGPGPGMTPWDGHDRAPATRRESVGHARLPYAVSEAIGGAPELPVARRLSTLGTFVDARRDSRRGSISAPAYAAPSPSWAPEATPTRRGSSASYDGGGPATVWVREDRRRSRAASQDGEPQIYVQRDPNSTYYTGHGVQREPDAAYYAGHGVQRFATDPYAGDRGAHIAGRRPSSRDNGHGYSNRRNSQSMGGGAYNDYYL